METVKVVNHEEGGVKLLDLPMRDGNRVWTGKIEPHVYAFRPSYEGWKPNIGTTRKRAVV